MREVWKDLMDYEGLYQISNLGRLKSLDRVVRYKYSDRIFKGKVHNPPVGSNGYMTVCLTVNNKSKTLSLHRLVAKHFVPNPDNMREVNHIDGNKTNNRADNLEWVSSSQNKLHGLKSKLYRSGEDHELSKISSNDTAYIRRMRGIKTGVELAEELG